MERLDVLMGVTIDHTLYQGVFAKLKLDILGGFHLTAREMNVERDIVRTVIQLVPLWDLRLWSIIFPSKPRVSLLPFVSTSSNAICSW